MQNYFSLSSGVTESFFLPFARRAASTLLPLAVDILSLNPCLFTLFLLDGWYVLFIVYLFYCVSCFETAKIVFFFIIQTGR